MPVRRSVILIGLVAAVFAAAAIPALAAKAYHAENFHSRVVVEPDGSILVTETIRFEFGPDSFTYVYRELPRWRTDGLTVLDATMDGIRLERGKAPGQWELKRDKNQRRVIWHFAATSDSAHTFTLTYRAAGVAWQDTDSDVVAWTLLPTRHEYEIDRASGEVIYPAGAVLAGDPAFDPPALDVRHDAQAIRFERGPVEPGASWVVTLRFAPRSVARVAPAWQQQAARNRESLPLFLGLGGLILLAGIGGFTFFALNHRQVPIDDGGAVPAPPDDLPPALAGALLQRGASAGWGTLLGGLLDLARRGAVSVESIAGSGLFKSHEVRITAGRTPPDARPHERVLLELMFTGKNGPRTSVTFSELAKTFAASRQGKRLRDSITAELRADGLLDAERERTRNRATLLGLAILLSAFPGFVISVIVSDRVGEPVLALPIALLIVGIVGMIVGVTISPLSDEGHRRAARWSAFKRALGDVAGASTAAPPTAEHLERWLPYAVAFGTALAWTKHLQKQGVTAGPSWLTAVSREGASGPASIAATVAVLSAGSNAGAHAGGGGVGGASTAAGGGASGAG
ncbi:MAG: DUF2207 family protein [Rhodospirillaceae bacterium]